jgi:hypothetical protein
MPLRHRRPEARSGRFPGFSVLRQPITGTIPGGCIGHPDVIGRRCQLGSLERANGQVDLFRALGASVSERSTALPAESAMHARRGLEFPGSRPRPGQVAAPHGKPANGVRTGGAAARFTVTERRRVQQRPAPVTNGPAQATAGQYLRAMVGRCLTRWCRLDHLLRTSPRDWQIQ